MLGSYLRIDLGFRNGPQPSRPKNKILYPFLSFQRSITRYFPAYCSWYLISSYILFSSFFLNSLRVLTNKNKGKISSVHDMKAYKGGVEI